MFGKATTLHASDFDGDEFLCVPLSPSAHARYVSYKKPEPLSFVSFIRFNDMLKLSNPDIYNSDRSNVLLECFCTMPPEWREQPEHKQVGELLLKRASVNSSNALKAAYDHEHMDLFAQLLDNGAMFDRHHAYHKGRNERKEKVAMYQLYNQVHKPRNLFLESINVTSHGTDFDPQYNNNTNSLFL